MDIVQVVVQAGAVGVAIFAIKVLRDVQKDMNALVGNHLDHNTKAMIELKEVLISIKQYIHEHLK